MVEVDIIGGRNDDAFDSSLTTNRWRRAREIAKAKNMTVEEMVASLVRIYWKAP